MLSPDLIGFWTVGLHSNWLCCVTARMGSQVFVPFRCLEDDFKHLKLMGDLGQVPKHSLLTVILSVGSLGSL
jgi:hypothetical protein